MASDQSVLDFTRSIGSMAPLSHQNDLFALQSPISITTEAAAALRRVRHAHIEDLPTASDLVDVIDLSIAAYLSCVHPVRSDLLADHVLLLSRLLRFADTPNPSQLLEPLALSVASPQDHQTSLEVLSGLVRSTEFSSVELARRVALSMSSTIRSRSIDFRRAWLEESPLYASVVAVATSLLFPNGVGHVPAHTPCPSNEVNKRFATAATSLTISNAPLFRASIACLKDKITLTLDRPTYVTFAALLLEEPASIGTSYPHAAISYPKANKSSLLRSGSVAFQLTPQRFRELQALFQRAWLDPSLQAWRRFRTLQFGDI